MNDNEFDPILAAMIGNDEIADFKFADFLLKNPARAALAEPIKRMARSRSYARFHIEGLSPGNEVELISEMHLAAKSLASFASMLYVSYDPIVELTATIAQKSEDLIKDDKGGQQQAGQSLFKALCRHTANSVLEIYALLINKELDDRDEEGANKPAVPPSGVKPLEPTINTIQIAKAIGRNDSTIRTWSKDPDWPQALDDSVKPKVYPRKAIEEWLSEKKGLSLDEDRGRS